MAIFNAVIIYVYLKNVTTYTLFFFQFSNLLGTVYREGNLTFTPDGNSVISPVGNRLSIFDLKKYVSNSIIQN